MNSAAHSGWTWTGVKTYLLPLLLNEGEKCASYDGRDSFETKPDQKEIQRNYLDSMSFLLLPHIVNQHFLTASFRHFRNC